MLRNKLIDCLLYSTLGCASCLDGPSEVESTLSTSTSTTTITLTTTETPTTGGDAQVPPTSASELLMWLEAGTYTAWAAEGNYHPSSGPHGDFVRAWFNDVLAASLTASSEATHPQDSASVKELVSSGGNVIGWAVAVKTQADSDGGRGWYWYEIIGDNVIADGQGVGLCTGCHSSGQDFIQSAFP